MTIPSIKFSHDYHKLPRNLNTAGLLQVLAVDRKDLSPEFVEYDTAYPLFKNDLTRGDGHYPLPAGKLLLLLLQSGWLWTTIRRWTPQKEKYYRSLVGKELRIERRFE